MKNFKIVLFLLMICIIIFFILSSNLFIIKNIIVSGNQNIEAKEVIKLSNINYGENIFKINKRKSMLNILKNPYVKYIKIKRVLPNTICIDLIERQAMARVPYIGSYIYIDKEGMVLEVNTINNKKSIPTVNGLMFDTFKIGETLNVKNDPQFQSAKEVIGIIKATEFISQIKEIDVNSIDNIKLYTVNNITVILGSTNELQERIQFAKAIVNDLIQKNQKGVIDMSHKGNPIFRPE